MDSSLPVGSALRRLALLIALLLLPAGEIAAQVVVAERGLVGTGLRLRQLDGVKRVLLVAAHPDDEDTSLITALARRWGADVAYLSLSRGEGGQNLIGPELDEGLGIVRTGELLAARELDGGRQFFSRAFDFGFSKTAEESFRYWPRDEILADVVWVIRKFRPQVLVSVFPPDARAGHGQHQVAGILAHEAFEVAGDPTRFPDQLEGRDAVEPWSPDKLYRSSRFDPGSATLEVETGALDPLLGRSHHQLAMESRSQHRSQDMGSAQRMGPRSTWLELVESRVETPGGTGLFAGVDTALVAVVDGLPPGPRGRARAEIVRYRQTVREAREGADLDPEGVAPSLARAIAALDRALEAVGSDEEGLDARRVLGQKRNLAEETLLSAAGVVVRMEADDDLVVPGEVLDVVVSVWNGGGYPLTRVAPELDLPAGWSAEPLEREPERAGRGRFDPGDARGGAYENGLSTVSPGSMARWGFRIRVPADAEPSRLYYLREDRDGEIYRWPEDRSLWGLPRNPPLLSADVELSLAPGNAGPVDVDVSAPAEYVGVDDALGEFTRPVLVVPALSVLARPDIMAWPVSERSARSVSVSVRNEARDGFRGRLSLEVPPGWTVRPREVDLSLGEAGEERSVSFEVSPGDGAEPGLHPLRAVAESESGSRYAEGFRVVDYPHIERDLLFDEAVTRVSMFPVRVDENLRVGYVMGTGDDGADALRQIGVDVTVLGPEQVRNGAFRDLDVVVLGIRAYETRPDLVGANQQLLDWVRDGGRLIVQYNRYEFSGAGYAPFPVTISRPHDRVTYETAPVALLDPESPLFERPNEIGEADFEGWAQERGLYFLRSWDDRYTPLLEMADPGEDPVRGSLLVTPLGDGLWVYTGIAFFRQFPEGVPGAYRLLANLISLDPEEWRAHHGDPGSSGQP